MYAYVVYNNNLFFITLFNSQVRYNSPINIIQIKKVGIYFSEQCRYNF